LVHFGRNNHGHWIIEYLTKFIPLGRLRMGSVVSRYGHFRKNGNWLDLFEAGWVLSWAGWKWSRHMQSIGFYSDSQNGQCVRGAVMRSAEKIYKSDPPER
jgi:hypothetical protein